MKSFLLLILVLFFSIHSFSQNWSVINSSDKFNYRLDGDNIITSTIWADSIQWTGSDTVFFLNRIMCDSCATLAGGPNPCDTCYGLKNQPQFMQRKIIVSPDGIINFRDTGNRVLHIQTTLNDTWLFDSTQNISATVVSEGTDFILGSADSVKTILLSTGDTIKLSKNFGILLYPGAYSENSYYRLAGIEGRNLGELVPKFAAFFNFDVGDMFEYHGYSGRLGVQCSFGGPDDGCEYIRKYMISAKNFSGDTIFYNIEGYRWQDCVNLSSLPPFVHTICYPIINTTIYFVDSLKHFTNKYRNELISVNNIAGTFFDNFWFPLENFYESQGSPKEYGKVSMLVDSNGVFTKLFGKRTSSPYDLSFYLQLDSTSDIMVPYNYPPAPLTFSAIGGTFKIGLGQTDFLYDTYFEIGGQEHLVAYRKDNDTVGVFTPDSVFTAGIMDNDFSNSILIYPNPADKVIHLDFPIGMDAELGISNALGKTQMKRNVSKQKTELDVSLLDAGFYFISIKTKKDIQSRKVLIMH